MDKLLQTKQNNLDRNLQKRRGKSRFTSIALCRSGCLASWSTCSANTAGAKGAPSKQRWSCAP
eukprot:3671278-Amphidinium_carterae.1